MPQIYGTCPVRVESLLLRWQKVLAKHTARMTPYNDLPYWNGERTNVGYIAQAASELQFAVMEEYMVDRGKVKTTPGRADLWIGGPSTDEYVFEFKLYWPSIKSNAKVLAGRIKGHLSETEKQLHSSQLGRQPSKIAMVFVCPWMPKADSLRWKELLDRFLKRVTRPQDYGGEFSAAFVPPVHLHGPARVAGDQRMYPAIAVFGKMV